MTQKGKKKDSTNKLNVVFSRLDEKNQDFALTVLQTLKFTQEKQAQETNLHKISSKRKTKGRKSVETNVQQLETHAREIRLKVMESIYCAQSGHPGGSLSICDMLAVLYFDQMNVNPQAPLWEERDRFVLSKGHAAPAYYAALALRGYFPVAELQNLRKIDSFLQGHPCMKKVPGVDMSTGSLGQGLSAANGMAIMGKMDCKEYRVYCICGDGEMQEGQIWEAVMTAAHYKLDNLTLLVDNNGLQIDGEVSAVMNNMPIAEKLRSFGWNVLEIRGHDIAQIQCALKAAQQFSGAPTAIVCATIKGKGVSYMENQAGWHGAAPNQEQYEQAVRELSEEVTA